MIKKFALFLLALFLLFLFFKVDSVLKSRLLAASNAIKLSIVEAYDKTKERIDSFFDQSQKILQLQRQVQEAKRYRVLYEDAIFRVQKLQKLCNASFDPQNFSLRLTKIIAYKQLGDFTAAWIDADLMQERIYGLVTPKGVAGIALKSDGGALALFNGNKQCSYTVSIANGIKGIATGSGDNRYVVVKYIQSFEDVKVGDRVYTNSFDNIFPYGVDVGIVERVWQEGSYKVAKVKLFEDLREPLYFWLTVSRSNEVIK